MKLKEIGLCLLVIIMLSAIATALLYNDDRAYNGIESKIVIRTRCDIAEKKKAILDWQLKVLEDNGYALEEIKTEHRGNSEYVMAIGTVRRECSTALEKKGDNENN